MEEPKPHPQRVTIAAVIDDNDDSKVVWDRSDGYAHSHTHWCEAIRDQPAPAPSPAEPSQQARRAAERAIRDLRITDPCVHTDKLAAIIERETGVGELTEKLEDLDDLLRELYNVASIAEDSGDLHHRSLFFIKRTIEEKAPEIRAYLAKNQTP
jgi:hypothetical protein